MRFAAAVLLGCALAAAVAAADYQQERAEMVDTIKQLVERTAEATGVEELDPAVVEAMASVPRHRFVLEDYKEVAYANRPLPIGYGQTISQPYIVALMTQLADIDKGDVVFELGTGSGYQSAVAATIAKEVYSMEIIPQLAQRASETLQATGYTDVAVRNADGYFGWSEHAPYDAIIVTAAVDHVPPPLINQLAPGGKLVLPLGNPYTSQVLTVVTKGKDGHIYTRQVLPVQFVPLTGGH